MIITKNQQLLYFVLTVVSGLSMVFIPYPISIMIILCSIFINSKVIYPLLLISPILDHGDSLFEFLTITKLLGCIYIFIIVRKMLVNKKNRIKLNTEYKLLIAWLLVLIVGLFNIIYIHNNHIYDFSGLLIENITRISKLIMAFFLFFDMSNRSVEELKQLFKDMIMPISVLLLFSCTYLLFNNSTTNYYYQYKRLSLGSSDPNDFASLLASISFFPIYSFVKSKKTMTSKYISLIVLHIIMVAIVKTLSRGGLLTFLFVIIISFIILVNEINKKVIYSLYIVAILMVLIYTQVINIEALVFRWTFSSSALSSITTYRSDWWKAGILYTVKNGPFMGIGGSIQVEHFINDLYYSIKTVMHSIYIDVFTQYGLLGLLVFLLIIFYMSRHYIKNILFYRFGDYSVLLVPYLFLTAILFSGLALSWLFKEILWILIGINLGIIFRMRREMNLKG